MKRSAITSDGLCRGQPLLDVNYGSLATELRRRATVECVRLLTAFLLLSSACGGLPVQVHVEDAGTGTPQVRTLPESAPQAESVAFIDALTSVQFKMDWYRDYRVSRGAEKLPFVGRFLARSRLAPEVVAKDMRQVLRLKADDRRTARNWEEYLRLLVTRAENAGIWVMRSGVVGNNTHRPLSVDVFRGFAISDPIVPLVFINVRDARAAQIFTLAHELAHLWIGESGISDPFAENVVSAPPGGVEPFCNATAAELLVPRDEFEREWRQRDELVDNTSRLSTHFRVSRIVIAIRARVLNLVTATNFQEFLASERSKWAKDREDTAGGGDYYRTARARNGTDFVRAVLGRAASGELLLRDAGRLLDMTPKSVREAHHRQEEAR